MLPGRVLCVTLLSNKNMCEKLILCHLWLRRPVGPTYLTFLLNNRTWYYRKLATMFSYTYFGTENNFFRIEVHPSKMNGASFIWDFPVTTNDFALLKLAREIDLTATPNVKAACWPSYDPVPGDNNVS